jgi:predicted dienelactone hydrolase
MGVQKRALGKFAVGHSIRPLTVTGDLGESRETDVEVWYPATKSSRPLAVYTSRLNGVPLLPEWDSLAWAVTSEEAREDAPIDTTSGAFPVIIFTHGNLGNSFDYAFTLENIASAGFVVAGLNHVNNTQDDVRIDYVNDRAGFTLLPCFDDLAHPCSRFTTTNESHSFVDRARDVSAVLDALPRWFERSVDACQAGIMGHSRGGLTVLAAAGGSRYWGVDPELRVKALMTLAVGTGPGNPSFLDRVDLVNVTVPALLVAGSLDQLAPPAVSQHVYDTISSNEKTFIVIENAVHATFDSAYCGQLQSSGTIAQQSSRAILDRHTAQLVLGGGGVRGNALDFCKFEDFTIPTDIRPLVREITGFDVTRDNVPRTGLDTEALKEDVTEMAVSFFGPVLRRNADRPSFVSSGCEESHSRAP